MLAGCSGGQLLTLSTQRQCQLSKVTASVLQDCPYPHTSDTRMFSVLTDCSHRSPRPCFSALKNLLEQLAECRVKTILLPRIVVYVIKGYNSGRERQKRCTGQEMQRGWSFQAVSRPVTPSAPVLHQPRNTPNPSFWGFLRKQDWLNH